MYKHINRLHQFLMTLFVMHLIFAVYVFGQSAYESYYHRCARNYPFNADLGDREIQGVAHDQDNWYFTWTNKDPNIGFLSKIPLGIPLDNGVLGALTPRYPSQIIRNMGQYSFFNNTTYWHWGDPDHYKDVKRNIDYIVVPISGDSPPIVAIFRAADLSLALIGDLTQQTSSYCNSVLGAQRSVGWCAIHPQTGELYTSEDFDYTACIPGNCDDQSHILVYPRELLHYRIPWDSIPSSGYIKRTLPSVGTPQLLRGANGEFIELYNMQGGEFTSSGELLYISCGSGCCLGQGVGQMYRSDGIYVFDTNTWRAIKRSNNHYYNNNHPSYFDYYYILDCDDCTWCTGGSWSPEGLTIWDLDNNGLDSQLSGQLHVLLFHCQIGGGTKSCSDNEVAFEHFGGRLYVDPVNGVDRPLPTSLGDSPIPGGITLPFKTLGYAYNAAWDGSEIVIKAGSYPAVGTYSKRVRLVSQDGSAILGK